METKYELKKLERRIKMGCGNEISDWDDRAVQDSLAGKNTGFDPKMLAEVMPEVERDIERLDKEFNEKWQEIEREFPKIEEVLEAEVEKSSIAITSEEKWDLDRFEKDGFGSYVTQPPDFEKLFPEVKIEEIPKAKFGKEGQTLAETDRLTGTDTKLYESRIGEEIKEKEMQILRGISPPQATPEEIAILKELQVAKDVEKMQRELIKEQSKIHDYGHHIISPEIQGRVLTPVQLDKWQRIYEECKESGKFVTQYASKNWEEFFCENLRVFFTHPEWVKEQHPAAYHEVDKTVTHLRVLEIAKQAKEGKWEIKT